MVGAEVREILLFYVLRKKKLHYFCKVFIESLDIVHCAAMKQSSSVGVELEDR